MGAADKRGQQGPQNAQNAAEHAQSTPEPARPIAAATYASPSPDARTEAAKTPASKESFGGVSYEGWIAVFTGVLTVATIGLWVATSLQIRHSKREFVATHRPRIRVRRIDENSVGPNFIRAALITVANVGDTKATITGISGSIDVRNKMNGRWVGPGPHTSAQGVPPNNVLIGGQSQTYDLRSSIGIVDDLFEGDGRVGDMMGIGEIAYRDDNGVERRTGFGWLWQPRSARWIFAEQDPLNYED